MNDTEPVDWEAERATYDAAGNQARPGCETCGSTEHETHNHEWTFARQHTHPGTGESLEWCYVVIAGTHISAAEQASRLFGGNGYRVGRPGGGVAGQYVSERAAGVDRYGLRLVQWPTRDELAGLDP